MNPPFSIAIAKACLDASALSYDRATVQSSVAHVLIQETEIDGEWYLVVAFRGTENIRDWLTDIEARLGRVVMVGETHLPKHERLHRGFLYSTSSVLPELIRELRDFYKSPILVTGHSKGGAEAMIAAASFLGASFEVAGVYTFGQPRVGNSQFVRSYETSGNLGQRTFRFVNEEDLVPRVPGLLIGYRHAGQEIFFPSDRAGFEVNPSVALKVLSDCAGAARDFVCGTISCIRDHFVTEYQHRFKKEFGQTKPEEVAA